MKIQDLFEFDNDIEIDSALDRNLALIPVYHTNDIRENSILIYPKSITAKRYVIPDNISTRPYAIIVGKDIEEESVQSIPLIKVRDPRKIASFVFNMEYKIDYSKLKVIAITGTNGKTTTSEMLFSILREAKFNVGYIGTGEIRINESVLSDSYYSMTTPDPDVLYKSLHLMQKASCEYVIMEVSSHAISLSKVAPIHFKCALFTNLSEEHMDFHTDMEDYYRTKLSLFQEADCGIFNLDDPYSKRAALSKITKPLTVGIIDTSGDSHITDYTDFGIDGSSFFYKEQNLIFKITLALGGAFNVYNALMATKCAISLGVKPKIIKSALSSLTSVRGRLNVIKDDITVVIDYAHTTKAFEELLCFLKRTLSSGQKLISVFGCGGDRDKSKRSLMGLCAERFSDFVIITEDNNRSENFKEIAKMITAGMSEKKHLIIEDRKRAIHNAILNASDGDTVAIIGKGHEKYMINNTGKFDFDETEIVKSALRERRLKNDNQA